VFREVSMAMATRGRPVRVVLLDLAMPVMDGIEALPIIRALVPDARIIVLSAFSEAVREQALDWGADGYLVKGTPLKKIVEYVEASLGD